MFSSPKKQNTHSFQVHIEHSLGLTTKQDSTKLSAEIISSSRELFPQHQHHHHAYKPGLAFWRAREQVERGPSCPTQGSRHWSKAILDHLAPAKGNYPAGSQNHEKQKLIVALSH